MDSSFRVWRNVLPVEAPTWERLLRVLGLAVFAVFAVRSWTTAVAGTGDFDGFHRAAKSLLEHGRVLRGGAVERYLPQFQALLVPFALLPIGLAGLLWYLISVAALLATPGELELLSGVPPREQIPAWFVAAPFVWGDLHLGQSGVVLLYAALWATNRARDGASVTGGAVLGLVALFKIPALALTAPALLLARPIRVLVGWTAAAVAVTAVLVTLAGWDDTIAGMVDWTRFVAKEGTPAAMVEADRSLRHNNQSLAITLARTFGEMPAGNRPCGLALVELPLPLIWHVVSAVTALLVLVGIACVVRAFRRRCDRESWLVVTVLSALGMLIVSPLVWTHYFVWILPAVVALRAPARLVFGVGVVSLLCLTSPVVRSLGPHLLLSVALFAVLAVRFLRAPLPTPADGRH